MSVELLCYDVLSVARKENGSGRKRGADRLYTVVQYCVDMALSFKENIRICRENSRMIHVVGREFRVLGYHFQNSWLIYEIGACDLSL